MSTPEPYVVKGGPFDLKVVARSATHIALVVMGNKDDILSYMNISKKRIPALVSALLEVK